jgi:branched-subunit amino acid transport protein
MTMFHCIVHHSWLMLNCYIPQWLCRNPMSIKGYATLWHSSRVILDCLGHIMMLIFIVLCWIVTFIKSYITLRHSLRVMSPYNIPWGLCFSVMFLNGHDALWYSSWSTYMELLCCLMVISHYDIHQGLCHICDVPSWLRCIAKFILVDLCWIAMILKGYVTLWCSWKDMLDCHVTQWLCNIVTFIFVYLCWTDVFLNGYVAMWSSLRVRLYCDVP